MATLSIGSPTVTTEPPKRRPRSLRRAPWFVWPLLALVLLIFLVPGIWMILAALRPNEELYQWPPQFIPGSISLDNVKGALAAAPFGRFFMNSVIVTVIGATLKVILAISTAYAFTFLRFPFRNALFLFMLGALMVPGHVTLLINYITIGNLGLINTYAGLILPSLASAFGVFLLRQHFMTVPKEILEAASLDGVGHIKRLIYFVVPMTKPAVVTVALVAAISDWNDFIWPLLVTNTVNMRTMPTGLLYLKQTEGTDDWALLMAGTSLVVLPMLILFLFAQRQIVSGLAGANLSR